MSSQQETFVTSRSRAPSIIDINSQNEKAFVHLPDLIQEAAVTTEFSAPNLQINRVYNPCIIESKYMTQPMFYIRSRSDSGIEMPDLNITDEKFILKYGSDLTANFAEIKTHGPKAFFQKRNLSNKTTYSLCACATGYIWILVRYLYKTRSQEEFSDLEIQIGTFALKTRAITTVEIPCQYKAARYENLLQDGKIAEFCTTVIGRYLRLRMMGQQYEDATETAISQSLNEARHTVRSVDPRKFGNFDLLLRELCANAPLPPISVVSLISRSMVIGRWQSWRDKSILRRRYFFPSKVTRCFQVSKNDSMDLLSEALKELELSSSRGI